MYCLLHTSVPSYIKRKLVTRGSVHDIHYPCDLYVKYKFAIFRRWFSYMTVKLFNNLSKTSRNLPLKFRLKKLKEYLFQ